MICIWSSTTNCVLPDRSRHTFLYSNILGNLHCITGVGNLSVKKPNKYSRHEYISSWIAMQMKLGNINKGFCTLWKKITSRKITIFYQKTFDLIYDLGFHGDKTIKKRVLNAKWSEMNHKNSEVQIFLSVFPFRSHDTGPACRRGSYSTNRCSFSLLQKRGRKQNDPPKSACLYIMGIYTCCSWRRLCNQHVCKMPIKYISVGIYPRVI